MSRLKLSIGFVLSVLLEIWFFHQALSFFFGQETTYSGEELFWLYLVHVFASMVALVAIFRHTSKQQYVPAPNTDESWKHPSSIFSMILIILLFGWILYNVEKSTWELFIPALPLGSVVFIFVYSFVSHLMQRLQLENFNASVADRHARPTAIRAIFFLIGIFAMLMYTDAFIGPNIFNHELVLVFSIPFVVFIENYNFWKKLTDK